MRDEVLELIDGETPGVLERKKLGKLNSIDVIIAPGVRAQASSYQRIRSNKVVIHQRFSLAGGSLEHDIALIKLNSPVANAAPVAIPTHGDNSVSAAGTTCYAVGYGVFDTGSWQQPDTLQLAEIEVIHNDTCNAPGRYNGGVRQGMICAGKLTGKPKGAGAGDSGGPLFVNTGSGPMQIGIVSFGNGLYSTISHPGVFTRISSYRNWVDSVIHADSALSIGGFEEIKPTVSRKDNSVLLELTSTPEQDVPYIIYGIDGRTVASGALPKGKMHHEIKAVLQPYAVYFLKLQSEGGRQTSLRIPVYLQ